MKAAVMRGPRDIVVEDRPVPEPGAGQALVRIRAVGICGSDVRGYTEENSKARQPGLIVGHEAAGEVAALGPGVSKVAVGDRVAIDPQVVCGVCPSCRHGWISVCDRKKVIGSSLRGFLDGAMAEYAAVPVSQLAGIPDSLGFAEAATAEPVSNALHAVARGEVGRGDAVVVIGAGTLGLCILQAARAAGAGKLIVVGSRSEYRMELARRLGADAVLRSGDAGTEDAIRALTGGRGADVVIDAAGYESSCAQAVAVARKRGRLVLFGNAQATIALNLAAVINKELVLAGSSGANEEFAQAIEALASGRMDVGPIITHRMPLADVRSAFGLLLESGSEAIKIILEP